MSLAKQLAERARIKEEKEKKIKEVAEMRAEIARVEEEKRRKEIEERELKKQNALYQKELEAARIREEKTFQYYNVNKYGRNVPPNREPIYIGDQIKNHGAWIPNGDGEFFLSDQYGDPELHLKGKFKKGIINGNGYIKIDDNWSWEGGFKDGNIHGKGELIHIDGTKKMVLAKNNQITCWHEELLDGKQVEIDDISLGIITKENRHIARVTIIRHVYDWRFYVRFHEDIHPKEREIDFSIMKKFTVLHRLPQCYDLCRFGIQMDTDPKYEYFQDNYGPGVIPKLGIAVGRKTAEMKLKGPKPLTAIQKIKTDYKENMFESLAAGIGAAQRENDKEGQKEQRQKQWAALIEERRQKEEEEREHAIKEEGEQMEKDAEEKRKLKQEEKRLENAEYESELKAAQEAAMKEFEGNMAGMAGMSLEAEEKMKEFGVDASLASKLLISDTKLIIASELDDAK